MKRLTVSVDDNPDAAREIGMRAAAHGVRDVVDGHIALLTLRPAAKVLTSDADDLLAWGVPAEAIVRC